MKIKNLLSLFFIICFSSLSICQPSIQWQRCMGGSEDDFANLVKQTKDGGYIVVGNTYSNDGDIKGFHKGVGADIWIVRLDANGNILWQRTMGGLLRKGPFLF